MQPSYELPANPVGAAHLRRFFLIVAAFTGYVTFWGLLFPQGMPIQLPGFAKGFDDALPFNIAIPPLHARFLGSFYGSATLLLLLQASKTRDWSAVRITVWIILVWTGILGVISYWHREIFDWTHPPAYAWYLAYTWFPLHAGWILWRQRTARGSSASARSERAAGSERLGGAGTLGGAPNTIGGPLRTWFWLQALVLIPLALALFVVPESMVATWPWKIPPILARIYAGPFMAYGVGSLLAARAASWGQVRGFVCAAIFFAVGTLLASGLHRALFNPERLVTWIWFGGFGAAAVVLVFLGAWSHHGRSD